MGLLAVSEGGHSLHPGDMTTNDAERMLELEESAQGEVLFRTPGEELQVEKARDQAEASGWIPTRDDLPTSDDVSEVHPSRLETARVCRDELLAAMQLLETTVAGPAAKADWIDGVTRAAHRLQLALAEHIAATEEPDGLLEEIVLIAPRLAHEAESLSAEHETLMKSMRRVIETISQPFDARTVRRRTLALLARLAEHRQRGSDLVYEAYSVDIGAAG
jgi:hypothetical protein